MIAMPIPKRPAIKAADPAAAAAFIDQAPDAKPAARWQRGAKTQVTWSLDPELLERLDAVARKRYLSRAALLTVWVREALEREAGG